MNSCFVSNELHALHMEQRVVMTCDDMLAKATHRFRWTCSHRISIDNQHRLTLNIDDNQNGSIIDVLTSQTYDVVEGRLRHLNAEIDDIKRVNANVYKCRGYFIVKRNDVLIGLKTADDGKTIMLNVGGRAVSLLSRVINS